MTENWKIVEVTGGDADESAKRKIKEQTREEKGIRDRKKSINFKKQQSLWK